MEKLTFQKAIDKLKNTECSSKEKIQKFDQIYQSLNSLITSSNYITYLKNALQVLLLFCEDNDSNVRISAEENLNRIIRTCEKNQQLTLVMIEIYHEIKKNGNERSLRICLNLFSHYCQHIKHRKRKVYAQNLVPCMLEIARRKETMVIETFVEFNKSFSQHLLNCLSDYEVMKLMDLFIDNLSVECTIKRRCAAQNIITILENSPKKVFVMKSVIARIQENLSKIQENNSSMLLGTLGLLRLLMPHMVSNNYQHQKVIEILETCLNMLKVENNHSLINANLEVVNSILIASNCNREIKDILCDDDKMTHKEMLLSRHTSILTSSFNQSRKSSTDTVKKQDNFLQIPHQSIHSTPNKSLGDFSDVEGDSFKSTDFDANIPTSSSPNALRNVIGAAETMSIKSTDSINSFFSSILTHSNAGTDAVTKFFRKSSTDSPVHQSKVSESTDEKSLDFSAGNLRNDDVFDSQALPETAEIALNEDNSLDLTIDTTETACIEATKELYIGSLYDQSVINFIVRLVSSKFLLDGTPKCLISDHIVRVSIKNLALSVINACVELKSDVLLMKLSKDFTDESMMVESLLSYLIDEDIRLEEEEKKKKQEKENFESTSTEQPQNFLEIKDDHFGECTTATFLDYFSPINQTLDDQGLISLKNRIYEEKTKDRDESTKKINKELCQFLSRSDIVDSKKIAPMMETTLKMPEDKDCQYVVDVLLYVSHGDPVLRANVYSIIGNFIKNVFENNLDYEKFINKNEFVRDPLKFSTLVELLLMGIKDEINSVVKQSLLAWQNCINLILPVMNERVIENTLNQLLMVSSNRYWLVQCKYCDVITKINLGVLENAIGSDRTESYEKQIQKHLFELIRDHDFRVRNQASESLTNWITCQNMSKLDLNSLQKFAEMNLINAFPFCINLSKSLNPNVEIRLSKILYGLSNSLMDLKEKNRLFGIIYALKILIRKFSPSNHPTIWKEFNILNILFSFINKNPGIALDISCQCDMLEIISYLISLECFTSGKIKDNNIEFFGHLLKILNIYTHLVNNMKLVIIPKGMGDLFISSKEHSFANNYGHFSHDYFYVKLYSVLKNSYESYRMMIHSDAEMKLKQLLHITLKNLSIMLESKLITKNDNELIEEIVGYLNQLIGFQPEDCIITTRSLLKFLFQRNYANRKAEIDDIISAANILDVKGFFEKYETFSSFDSVTVTQNSDSLIKLFDPLVIQSLRLFTKSSAILQTKVMEMLCQLLELNINYMKLDAKKVFVDIVLKQVEYIEDGAVINSEILAPKIVQFLIYLTKLKDKKILTIPKVINIIDTLLASTNKSARTSGVKALEVLIIDLFFNSNSPPTSNEPEILEEFAKDINTQKEVTLSMMMKFIEFEEIQICFEWIINKSRAIPSDTVIDQNELYQNFIQSIKEDSVIVGTFISSIAKNILLESKNLKAIINYYCKLLDLKSIDVLKTMNSIQESVLNIAEEIYFINHLKLQHQKPESEMDALIKFLKNLLRYLEYLVAEENVDLEKLNSVINFLKFDKFPTLKYEIRELLDIKRILEKTCDSTLDSVISLILSMGINASEIEKSLNFPEILSNQQKVSNSFYKMLFGARDNIKDWESAEIMSFFKDASKIGILLNYSQDYLLQNLLEDEEISRIVLRKLTVVNISSKRLKFILENAHENCLIDSTMFLISFASHQDSKILQLVIVKKLNLMKNTIMLNPDKKVKISIDVLEGMKTKIVEFKLDVKFMILIMTINDFIKFLKTENKIDVDFNEMNQTIDENWLMDELKNALSSGKSYQIAEVLYEIKSESKIINLLNSNKIEVNLLASAFHVGFERMLKNFRIECIQINPHLNYMKISPLLKCSLTCFERFLRGNNNNEKIVEISKIVKVFMTSIRTLYDTALIYVDAKYIDKFISDNLLKPSITESLLIFLDVIIEKLYEIVQIDIIIDAIKSLFKSELISIKEIDDRLIEWIHNFLKTSFKDTDFVTKYQHPQLFDELDTEVARNQSKTLKQAIFIAKLQEAYEDDEFYLVHIPSQTKYLVESSLELSRFALKLNKFYQFTITPYEILLNYRSGDDLLDKTHLKLKQIPIEYLSDSDLLERYVRRINHYGFTQRQEFEEIFMTLLVMLNQWNEMHDAEEQFYIKQLCLQTNIDLLLSCFRHCSNGYQKNSSFAHIPRNSKNWAKIELIGVKKLHHIQEVLDSSLNVFYQPNLERIDRQNNLITTKSFDMNQFSLDFTWNMTSDVPKKKISHHIKNVTYVHAEKLGIDNKSALQLIYDIMTQLIDENHVLILPQLAKLIDVLENNDQFRWINKKMYSLHESVCTEDTLSHQYIVYLLCRSSAVLVPSLGEIQQLVAIINKYLGCNHMFVRNAALHGLICLFEVLNKTNTTIGGINDEMKILRTAIINYTNKNGIVYECGVTSSTPLHNKLVWALNFYVIENTLKFGDCNELLIDTIISSNNILKRTNDIDLYFMILAGLERLIIVDADNRSFREKVEKLAVDLIKIENKSFAIGGLKLLVTCMYISSLEQLENTEKSNGIVQDEPEIVMQYTEKIDILFSRIRNSTQDEAEVFGKVLGQILKDLLSPNEILTKIIKELLVLNQSNTLIISKIIHQVFRTAIDSSFLPLLQEWLICSLSNFLTFPNHRKSIQFLTLIFMSSTLNLSLLKLFPIIQDDDISDKLLHKLFIISAKDFYSRLTEKQQVSFRDVFKSFRMEASTSPTKMFNKNLFEGFLENL